MGYLIGRLLKAIKKLCPKDNLFQTIKTIFNRIDYYSNKPTYVAVLETISFVERSLGREMFSISKTKHKAIANWLACLVVSFTVQFHPSCNKLEPYFHNKW